MSRGDRENTRRSRVKREKRQCRDFGISCDSRVINYQALLTNVQLLILSTFSANLSLKFTFMVSLRFTGGTSTGGTGNRRFSTSFQLTPAKNLCSFSSSASLTAPNLCFGFRFSSLLIRSLAASDIFFGIFNGPLSLIFYLLFDVFK